MYLSTFVSTLLLVAPVAWASAIPSKYVVHERRDTSAKGWTKSHRLHHNELIPLRFALVQSNLDCGHDFLMDISNPKSASYGKHWTTEQVETAFAPTNEAVDKVHHWLESSGLHPDRLQHSTGSITVGVTIAEAERLLKTTYHSFEHTTGHKQAGCELYHLPESLSHHIDFVTPGVALLDPAIDNAHEKRAARLSQRGAESLWSGRRSKPMPSWYHAHQSFRHGAEITSNNIDLANCDQVITPACIKALYHVPPASKACPGNELGIFENGDFYAQKDLDLFFSNYTDYIPNGTHPTLDSIDGGYAPVNLSEAGGESSLDLQLAYPLIYPQGITLFQTDDINYSTGNLTTLASGGYNTWLDAIDGSYCTYSAFGETGDSPIDPTYPDPLPGGYKGQLQCGTYKPTNVMSVSYSRQEWDHPVNYQKRQCNEFMKLALQGHTILFSSGDTGVAGRPSDPLPNGCLGANNTIFNPRWPDSCPYLTVVGATKVYPGFTVEDPESVANDPFEKYSSGGGFSNVYPIPDYQASAVATYFEQHDPGYKYYSGNQSLGENGGLYNRTGRGYPDVSANGDNIAVYVGGVPRLEGGTSASTPIFASIINRINEERLAIGKGTVGFINPVLYSHPEVLNDIVNGTNPGCGTQGFAAVKGWDPSSGLGTPNYPKMLELFLSLP